MTLKKKKTNNIKVLFEYIKNNIKLIYTNSYKKYYYFILANLIIDYEKPVFKKTFTLLCINFKKLAKLSN